MLSDAQLMQLVQAGESGLFDELILRHRPGLLRFAGSMLADADAAEDAVQEALLAAFSARHTYDPQFAFSTWVYTILLNLCRRHHRRTQKQPALALNVERSLADAETPLDRLLQSEARAELAELLAELPDVEADALRLRFFAGLPFDEIARVMDSSLNGAKVRVRRGLTRLAERLQRRELLSHGRALTQDTSSDFPPLRRSHP